MPATNYQQQQTTSFENGYPVNYQEYQPQTWYNGQQQGSMSQRQQQQFGGHAEDVVISGVSGRFPESKSESVDELAQNLYNGIMREKRSKWQAEMGLFGMEKKYETIKEIIKETTKKSLQTELHFGGEFEMVKPLLEVTYEAIFDSGMNPVELKGTRTGVFIGAPHFGGEFTQQAKPYTLLAQELASVYDFHGPTQVYNTTCSSSLIALNEAINAIKSGQCEYAIVAGIGGQQHHHQITKSVSVHDFVGQQDQQEFGTVGVVFLQKKTATKRFYAKVLHSKLSMDLVKEQQQVGYPVGEVQTKVLREIYGQAEIDPTLVTYVEAHIPGQKMVDTQLFNSIAEVFAAPRLGRTMPLFIGSTQSKFGHQEPAQPIFALIKMMIAIQRGIIPANLHYQEPTQEGLMFVNTNTKFQGGLVALNSFCFGGVNAHIVMQPNNETTMKMMGEQSFWNQDLTEFKTMPRLFQFSAKSQQGVEEVLRQARLNPTDLATKFLLHASNSQTSPATHPFRGFTVLNGQTEIQEIGQVNYTKQDGEKLPVWFVFGGMGSQWQGMGQEMMAIETFRQSIKRSAEYLKPYGLNLIDLIYSKQQSIYQRPLNSFVGIAAVQIALVDCLRQAGIECDGMLGHSIGELGCAYADETLNGEETLLVAYYRGKLIEDAHLPQGAMAVIGLTWEEIQQRCPSGVVPACHNGRQQVTVSGPKRTIFEFVQQLNREGVYAKEIECTETAYHSYYLTSIAPQLKIALEKVIRSPKLRSSRWLSTSIPEQRWESDLAKYSSPDYHVNNMCSPVLFQETLKFVPSNAIVIEIGPHAYLKEILGQNLPKQTTIIPLMRKDVIGGHLEHFWTQLGRIYNRGINVDSVKMFVPIGREHTIYPVPVNAGFLSHFAKHHMPERFVQRQPWGRQSATGTEYPLRQVTKNTTVTYQYPVDLTTDMEESTYLRGNQIDGKVVYPVTGYLYLVWKSLAKMNGFEQVEQFPVAFENVEIQRATFLNGESKLVFTVTIMPTGLFEVTESGSVIISGRVYTPEKTVEFRQQQEWTTGQQQSGELIEQGEIYKQLRERGYEFSGEFQPIIRADAQGRQGELAWTGKWVPFLEALLQLNIFGGRQTELMMPKRIRSLRINPSVHLQTQRFFIGGQWNKPEYTKLNGEQQKEQPIELLEQWIEKFEKQQGEQHRFVQQLFKQYQQQMPEQCRRLMGEWETLAREGQQQKGEWTGEQKWAKKQHFEKLQHLIRHQQQQQRLVEQIVRFGQQFQVQPVQFPFGGKQQAQQEQIDELKQVVFEQHQFHLEQQIFEQEFEQMRQQLKQQLGQQLVIVKELVDLLSIGQWDVKFGQTQTLAVQLEQLIQDQLVQWYNRVGKWQQRRQLEKTYLQQLQQHLFTVQQVLGESSSVLTAELREVAKELESYIDEQIQYQVERESQVERMQKHQQSIQEQLKEQLQFVQQFTAQQRIDFDWSKKFLASLELFIQEQQQQESLYELKKQREQQMYWNAQQKLEKFVDALELFEQTQFNGQPKVQWIAELKQMLQQHKQLHQQFTWELQTPSFGGRRFQSKNFRQQEQTGETSSVFYPVTFNPITKTTVCGGVELFELDIAPVPRPQQRQQQSRVEFVPFIQKAGLVNGGKLVFIEQGPHKQRRQSLGEWEQPEQSIPTQFREFLEFYLNECKRFTGHIMRKIEQQSQQTTGTIIVPTPLPKSLEQLFEKQQSGKPISTAELVEGGKLLQLLIQAANLDNNDGQYFAKVQKLFNDKLAYWKALEEDRVLNYLNKRSYYLKSVLDNVLENGQQQPRQSEAQIEDMPQFNLIKRVKIALGDNVTLKVRDIILATEKLTNEVLERNKRIHERINASRALVDLIDNIKSISLQHQQQEQQQPKQWKQQMLSQVLPKVWFSPLQTYIITSGLTGFGLDLAQWMVERGARQVVLTSKFGMPRTQQQIKKLRYLQEEFGAQVKVLPLNVRDEEECFALIQEATQMSIEKKIGGIFHFDIVAQDNESQRMENYRCVANLDKCTRETMDESAYFVVFTTQRSEQQQQFGEQAIYGMPTKSIVQRIVESRRQEGKHALKIQWEELFGGEQQQQQSPFYVDEQTIAMPSPVYLQALKKFEQMLLKSVEGTFDGKWGQQYTQRQQPFVGQQWGKQQWGQQCGQQNGQQWGQQCGQQNGQQWGQQCGQQNGQQWGQQCGQQWGEQQQQQQKSLVEFVARILGGQRTEQTPLIELGLDMLMSAEIKQFIETHYQQVFTLKEIQQFTFEQLRQIEFGQRRQQFGQKRMNYLMPTKSIEKLNQVEFVMQSQQVPVVVIHPIEGHVNMLKSWAKHMKYPVYGVQYTQEAMQFETIEQLADFYWQKIETELFRQQRLTGVQGVQRVHLCGFGFGGSMAIEMSLRRPTYVASLTLLDAGKQQQQKQQEEEYLLKVSGGQWESPVEGEIEALYLFAQQYMQQLQKREFVQELTRLPREQRVRYVVRELMTKSQFQFEPVDLEQAARGYVAKVVMLNKYQPKQALRLSEVLLIKSSQQQPKQQGTEEFFGLNKIFNGKVQVHVVDGDHRSFLEGTNGFQVASIVNENLLRFF